MINEQLDWYYESPGRWTAQSPNMADDGVVVYYRITVGKRGLFSLGESDSILDAGSQLFETFHAAKIAAALIESKVSRER